jgi:hypothetical protein
MLDLHQQLPKTKTDIEKTAIQRQTQTFDKEIDALVCEVYGLTGDEIRMVEEERRIRESLQRPLCPRLDTLDESGRMRG